MRYGRSRSFKIIEIDTNGQTSIKRDSSSAKYRNYA